MAFERRRRPHENTPPPFPLVTIEEATAYKVPQTPEEWAIAERTVKLDANDIVHAGGPAGFRKWLDESPTYIIKWDESKITAANSYMRSYKSMREPVIHDLLRRSETMNIVAPPKSAKSWMGLNIAMNVIGGGVLFGKFPCERGKVLIVDNELHPETIAQRVKQVATAMNVPLDRAGRLIDFLSLRGQLTDLFALEAELKHVRRRAYNIIILDAFYKFYPIENFDENSNSMVSRLYTVLDSYADYLESGIILIHHSSKGNQGSKSVTDMGAGAGSQSRACDAHLVLQEHEQPGVYVISCANRSYSPIDPFCARFDWPVWKEVKNMDASEIKGRADKKKKFGDTKVGGSKDGDGSPFNWKEDEKHRIDEFFLSEVCTPMSIPDILSKGNGRSFRPWNRDRMKTLIPSLLKDGKIIVVKEAKGPHPATYISSVASEVVEQPKQPESKSESPSNDGYTAGFNSYVKKDGSELNSQHYDSDGNEMNGESSE